MLCMITYNVIHKLDKNHTVLYPSYSLNLARLRCLTFESQDALQTHRSGMKQVIKPVSLENFNIGLEESLHLTNTYCGFPIA